MPLPSEQSPFVLDLIALAKTSTGRPQRVPDTDLEVLALESSLSWSLVQPCWLLVLVGEIIIDMPFGNFRVLREGESIYLAFGEVALEPVELTVLLKQ